MLWDSKQTPTMPRTPKVNQCGHPDRPHYAHGRCHPCTLKFRRAGDLARLRSTKGRGTDVCGHPYSHQGYGLCKSCHARWLYRSKALRTDTRRVYLAPNGIGHDLDTHAAIHAIGAADLRWGLGFGTVEIEGARWWVGAALTDVDTDGGRNYILYRQL